MSRSRLSVVRLAEDRFRVRGLSPRSAMSQRIENWLEKQGRVKIDHRVTGSLDVSCPAGGQTAGTIERSLRDRLWVLNQPAPEPLDVRVAHELPGRVRLRVTGADDDEVLRLTAFLQGRPGVLRTSGSPASGSILVVFDRTQTTAEQLALDARTSDPAGWPEPPPPPPPMPWGTLAMSSAALAGAVTGAAPAGVVSGLVAASSLPAVRRMLKALEERRLNVDLLDVTAIGISLATGQPGTGAFITWLLSVGDILLEKASDRARTELSRLVSFDTPDAWRIEGARTVRVPAAKLRPGDRIVVSTGQRVAADGVVVSGLATVDEKALTGESEPRECGVDSRVLAATVVVEGEIVVLVQRVGASTTAAKIVHVLSSAGAKPMTLQRNAERVADHLVLPTFGLAGAAYALSQQFDRVTSVLITDFGTGLRVALPTTALAAVAAAARRGVLVKGAQYLERLSRADVVVFDKTGTLTEGEPEVEEIVPLNGMSRSEILALATAAEGQASHPVAQALRRRAEKDRISIPDATLGSTASVAGRGVTARIDGHDVRLGNARWMHEGGISTKRAEPLIKQQRLAARSSLLLAADGELVGVLAYADQAREESADVVRMLRAHGRRQVLLFSGDSKATVEVVARKLGVDEAIGEMLPEDKAERVKALQREGKVVAMVGDGINDAPALALADVGISLHGGADVALETADVVLLKGGLEQLPHAFEAADYAMQTVRRGLGLVIAPNAVAIAMAALGLLPPSAAAVVNNGSTVVAALAGLTPLWR